MRGGRLYSLKPEILTEEDLEAERSSPETSSKKYDPEALKKKYGRDFEEVFRQTSINRVRDSNKNDKLKVYSMNDGGFLINHMWIQGSILLFPTRVYLWGVSDPKHIRPHTLDLFKIVKPKPSKLILLRLHGGGDGQPRP